MADDLMTEKVLTEPKIVDYLRDLPDYKEFVEINGLREQFRGNRSRLAQYNARLNDWGGLSPISDDLQEVLDEAEHPYELFDPIVYFNINAHLVHGNIWIVFMGVGEAKDLRCPASKLLGTTFGYKISILQIKAVKQGETFGTYHHFVPPQFRK